MCLKLSEHLFRPTEDLQTKHMLLLLTLFLTRLLFQFNTLNNIDLVKPNLFCKKIILLPVFLIHYICVVSTLKKRLSETVLLSTTTCTFIEKNYSYLGA